MSLGIAKYSNTQPTPSDTDACNMESGRGKRMQKYSSQDMLDLSDKSSPASSAISKLMSNNAALDMLDLEARAAVDAAKDGQKMRKEGSKTRRQAQQEEIRQMQAGADKLREMADAKVGQALLSAVATMASAAASGSEDSSAKTVATALQTLEKVNPFGLELGYLEAEKAEIETRQESAKQEAETAGDDVQEGQRLQESMTNLMEKVLEARHAARTAAIKG